MSLVDFAVRTIEFYSFLIIVSILGSWFEPIRDSVVYQYVKKITEPYLKLFRIIVPMGNMSIDFSPVIGLFILSILKGLL